MTDVTVEHCCQIIQTYEPVQENRSVGILGIDGSQLQPLCLPLPHKK